MTTQTLPGGTFALADDLTVTRVGYGAMQLAGPGVFGPPADRATAVAVLREAVALGVTHIDTADFYGPYVTNQIIREALHPYPADLHIVTKVGSVRDAEGGWVPSRELDQLRQQVEQNLEHLSLDRLDVVNLRVGGLEAPEPASLAPQFAALAEHPADPRHVVGGAPPRERRGCGTRAARQRDRGTELDRRLNASRPDVRHVVRRLTSGRTVGPCRANRSRRRLSNRS